MARSRLLPDNFTLYLVVTVTLASVFPAQGGFAVALAWVTKVAVSLLFFLHGAKLSRQAIWAGLGHWRLQLAVVTTTFVLFPLLGWALAPVLRPLLTPNLYTGILFLCALPATVQSAIAFVSMARGNVPAAVCAASASTLLGVMLTPLVLGVLLTQTAAMGSPLEAMGRIGVQLLLPFIVGHLMRPLVSGFLQKRVAIMKGVDQGSILLVVYAAFSHAVIAGLWSQLPLTALMGLIGVCAVLLALVLLVTVFASRRLGFGKEDEIAIVFCGSTKSLVSGVPMANVLFTAQVAGAIVLPLMIFHQMQLMVCGVIAQRYARRANSATQAAKSPPMAQVLKP
ncbi:bile acid:sodium symporter family protein [Hydrogenophaga laconesensis]|uniref:Sodium/bile acid cotransporter 7 n=1 Tax=Hydrogenophaga laconesensis TaxID=1805971 RepID=A0ABU1V8I3_9BURK|nr:bile acid:sodium symporter family protein [Hydrogenophaga laconesensis]MDR7093775.1 sodium/bile acid cotransporter 7 [Hydrogenophaga laconesensis]